MNCVSVRTPLRVSCLGGGSDFANNFRKVEGFCLGGATQFASYVTLRRLSPAHPYRFKIHYSRVETADHKSQIQHPLVKACLDFAEWDAPLEIHYASDLPASSGMGTSSSFAVGLLHALFAMRGDYLTNHTLAEWAIKVEREDLQEAGGWQDQFFCALGGFRALRFQKNSQVNSWLVPTRPELTEHLLLAYTGITRLSAEVQAAAKPITERQLHQLVAAAQAGMAAVQTGDWADLGACLDLSWKIKVENTPGEHTGRLCGIHSKARLFGALGGKLLGAGQGGTFLFVVPPYKRPAVKDVLLSENCVCLDVEFDREGSRVIYAN